MPTLLLIKGFRFFFYSNESNEPMHVHVTKGGSEGKIWLEPLVFAYMHSFTAAEEKDVEEIILEHSENFKMKWYEYFGKK
jgi:hypothetical protein